MTSQASAPSKVILFGEHFVVHGVKAILASINRRIKISSKKIDEKSVIVKSNIGNIKIPLHESIKNIHTPFKPFFFIVKHSLDEFGFNHGVEVLIESSVPVGVGLGSSSSCCVAAAASISGLFTKLSRDKILELAINAEKTIFPNSSGADCTVCTFGGLIEYDKENGYKKIESQPNFFLVIANSGKTHSTSKTVAKVMKFKEENDSVFADLCKKESQLVDEAIFSLKQNDLHAIGKSMNDNQKYLEQIGVSNKKLDSMIDLAQKTAYGAKLTGAGDGGCIIALTDETNLDKTMKNFEGMYECFSTKIDYAGLDTF